LRSSLLEDVDNTFNYFLKTRTEQDLNRRVDALIRMHEPSYDKRQGGAQKRQKTEQS
jgi:hypothetical protein